MSVVKAQSEGRASMKLVRETLVIAVARTPLNPWGSNVTPVEAMVPAIGFPPMTPLLVPIPLELTGITL